MEDGGFARRCTYLLSLASTCWRDIACDRSRDKGFNNVTCQNRDARAVVLGLIEYLIIQPIPGHRLMDMLNGSTAAGGLPWIVIQCSAIAYFYPMSQIHNSRFPFSPLSPDTLVRTCRSASSCVRWHCQL